MCADALVPYTSYLWIITKILFWKYLFFIWYCKNSKITIKNKPYSKFVQIFSFVVIYENKTALLSSS